MPNQYSRLTKENIERKLNRKRHPVSNAVSLAKEFGCNTTYRRSDNSIGHRAPSSFVRKVKSLIGDNAYLQLRETKYVNRLYR